MHPASYDPLNRLRTITDASETATVGHFAYDALGRRIKWVDGSDEEADPQIWYYYDGVNEIMETYIGGELDDVLRWYVHGVSYIDERLMMHWELDMATEQPVDASYYYALDRMYDVRYLLDAAGAIVESYAYDPYGRPLIRECAGRGDMTGDSVVANPADYDQHKNAMNCDIFDPRADIDDDGDVDTDDETLFLVKESIWDGTDPTPITTPRSLLGNPYMFQGRPHFTWEYDGAVLMLNDHRNRFVDPMTGRWLTRDPIYYFEAALTPLSQDNEDEAGATDPEIMSIPLADALTLFRLLDNNPSSMSDPIGLLSYSGDDVDDYIRGYRNTPRDRMNEHKEKLARLCLAATGGTGGIAAIVDCVGRCLDKHNVAGKAIGGGLVVGGGVEAGKIKSKGRGSLPSGASKGARWISRIAARVTKPLNRPGAGKFGTRLGGAITRGAKAWARSGKGAGATAGILTAGGIALYYEIMCTIECKKDPNAY